MGLYFPDFGAKTRGLNFLKNFAPTLWKKNLPFFILLHPKFVERVGILGYLDIDFVPKEGVEQVQYLNAQISRFPRISFPNSGFVINRALHTPIKSGFLTHGKEATAPYHARTRTLH